MISAKASLWAREMAQCEGICHQTQWPEFNPHMVERINSQVMLSDLHMYLSHSTTFVVFCLKKKVLRENSIGVGPTERVTRSPQVQHTVPSCTFVGQDRGANSISLE